MKSAFRLAAAVCGGLAGGAFAATACGRQRWNRETDRAIDLLDGPRGDLPEAFTDVSAFSHEQLAGLPAPVASYFKFAIPEGQPLISSARIVHAGKFRTGGMEAPWLSFTSRQTVSTSPPGFVWDARIALAPGITVRVCDSYSHGSGRLLAKLAALWTVAKASSSPELNSAALQRYLAEAVWCPTALLPSQGVQWTAVDQSTAKASLTDHGTTASLLFTFKGTGPITRVFTPSRFRDVDGQFVPTPWAGYYGLYDRLGGMMAPTDGEAEWILPAGRLPYWKGQIQSIDYRFDPKTT